MAKDSQKTKKNYLLLILFILIGIVAAYILTKYIPAINNHPTNRDSISRIEQRGVSMTTSLVEGKVGSKVLVKISGVPPEKYTSYMGFMFKDYQGGYLSLSTDPNTYTSIDQSTLTPDGTFEVTLTIPDKVNVKIPNTFDDEKLSPTTVGEGEISFRYSNINLPSDQGSDKVLSLPFYVTK